MVAAGAGAGRHASLPPLGGGRGDAARAGQYAHDGRKPQQKSDDAEEKMAQINMAYDVLSNPKHRKMYDLYYHKKQ